MIRQAGRLYRDARLRSPDWSPELTASFFGSLARTVWANEIVTADLLIRKHELAAKHIHIVAGQALIIDHAVFGEKHTLAGSCAGSSGEQQLQSELKACSPFSSSRRSLSKIQHIKKMKNCGPL